MKTSTLIEILLEPKDLEKIALDYLVDADKVPDLNYHSCIVKQNGVHLLFKETDKKDPFDTMRYMHLEPLDEC